MTEDEKLFIKKYAKAIPTITLQQHIKDLQKFLNLNSLEELKMMGLKNKKNLSLDEIKENAKFEIETYIEEIKQFKGEENGDN